MPSKNSFICVEISLGDTKEPSSTTRIKESYELAATRPNSNRHMIHAPVPVERGVFNHKELREAQNSEINSLPTPRPSPKLAFALKLSGHGRRFFYLPDICNTHILVQSVTTDEEDPSAEYIYKLFESRVIQVLESLELELKQTELSPDANGLRRLGFREVEDKEQRMQLYKEIDEFDCCTVEELFSLQELKRKVVVLML